MKQFCIRVSDPLLSILLSGEGITFAGRLARFSWQEAIDSDDVDDESSYQSRNAFARSLSRHVFFIYKAFVSLWMASLEMQPWKV